MARLNLIIFYILEIFHFTGCLVMGKYVDNQESTPSKWQNRNDIKERHDSSDNNGVISAAPVTVNPFSKTDTTTSNDGFVNDLIFQNRGEVLEDTDCLVLLQDSLVTTSIQQGRLFSTRIAALQLQNAHPECEQSLSKIYKEHVDGYLRTYYNDLQAVLSKIDEEIHVTTTPERLHLLSPTMDAPECWNPADDDTNMDLEKAAMIVLEKWDLCCSQIVAVPHQEEKEEECFHVHPQTMKRTRLCCGFYQGSLSQLRLPALQELSLNIRLRTTTTTTASSDDFLLLQVHQEGFLRKFDPSGVLWPTAYLLSLCIVNPSNCGISEIILDAIHGCPPSSAVVSVELGAGVGLPSLAMSHLLQQQQQQAGEITAKRVLATDRALHALVLTHLNSQLAELPLIVAQVEDHSNLTQLIDLKQDKHFNNGAGFSIVLGSSLQSMFDYETRDPHHKLWSVLDTLLGENNPSAIAILAHAVDAVTPPLPLSASVFECIKRISGNHFDMRTRRGEDSDFEISIYRRRRKGQNDKRTVSDEL